MNMRLKGLVALAILVGLSGCGNNSLSDFNPFNRGDPRLPGDRQDVLTEPNPLTVNPDATSVRAIVVPPAVSNGDWPQPGGTPSNAPGNLAYSGGGQRIWSSSAGEGTGDNGNISASPVVAGGRVYTMDVKGTITAFSAASGGRAWRMSIVPEGEDDDGITGGGLAASNGILYVVTGYGEIIALDQGSGQRLWTVNMEIPMRSAPTVDGGTLYAVSTDNRIFAVSTADGSKLWTYRGIPESTGLVSGASPAVSGDMVVVPFSSGEIIAFKSATGDPVWAETLTRTRSFTSLSGIREVAARPVVQNGIVYAVSVSGRMIATGLADGERIWTRNFSGVHTPAIAGDSLFAVDVDGRLVAFDRLTGEVLWLIELPEDDRDPERWAGPVIAGGRLWLASTQGRMVSVDPVTGQLGTERSVGDPVRMQPIVAANRIYVLTDDANLVAFN